MSPHAVRRPPSADPRRASAARDRLRAALVDQLGRRTPPGPGDLVAPPRRRRLPHRRQRARLSVGVVLLASVVTAWSLASASTARSRWGEAAPVVVMAHAVAPGALVPASAVERRTLPRTLVPSDAVTDPAAAIGRAARGPLGDGEILTGHDLAPADLAGPAASLRPGQRAVAVPVGDESPFVGVGATVDLVSVGGQVPWSPEGADPSGGWSGAALVAPAAVVLEVGPAQLVVAVDEGQVADLATALGAGPLLISARGACEGVVAPDVSCPTG